MPGCSSRRSARPVWYLAAEGRAAKTIRTYIEAVQWFAAAHPRERTSRTGWEQVGGQDAQRWMVYLLGEYSAAYASNRFRGLQQRQATVAEIKALIATGLVRCSRRGFAAGHNGRAQRLRADLNAATSHSPLSPFAMTDDARRTWDELTIGRKREIARILLTVTLPPLGRGHTFNRDLIQISGPSTATARAA
jgi:hypothetical protein